LEAIVTNIKKMKSKIFMLSLLSMLFVGLSCSSQTNLPNYNRKWMLVEFQGFTKENLIKNKAYIDLTDKENGGAKMGCNGMFFTYKVKSQNKIEFSQIGSTMMYCDGNMDLEQKFGQFLPTMTHYEVKGHFLTLKNNKGETMKFVAEDWD
jgi:heat shock protein HslJ